MRRVVVALACAAALAGGGCGLGPGEGSGGGASVSVTRDFGQSSMGAARVEQIAAGETVMRLLQRSFDVKTRYSGNFVQSINGIAGGGEGGREDWFFYVNGIEASEGAAERKLAEGDRVWWDHHRWEAAMRVPAVVGSFPEPFRSGSDGQRRPVRLDCASDAAAACRRAREQLNAAGVPAVSLAAITAPSGIEVLRIVVGTWRQVRRDPTAVLLEKGPAVSGVYVRPVDEGARIELLDQRGEIARELAPGGGLIAATRYSDQQPTWVVTGTDSAGVDAAVGALAESVLRDRFAVAVEGRRPVALPVEASG